MSVIKRSRYGYEFIEVFLLYCLDRIIYVSRPCFDSRRDYGKR